MAYWKIKKECNNESYENLIIFNKDRKDFETIFNTPEKYKEALQKGVNATDKEINIINFMTDFYPIEIVINLLTAFKFKNKEDIINAKFMLAPSVNEAMSHFEFVDSQDIKELLSSANISINKFAKKIHAPVRTLRDKMNIHKPNSRLSFSEKYLAHVLFYGKD